MDGYKISKPIPILHVIMCRVSIGLASQIQVQKSKYMILNNTINDFSKEIYRFDILIYIFDNSYSLVSPLG